MDEMEKALREELEKHLDTLRRNLEVVPMDVLKTKYKKPYQELKESICKAATAYAQPTNEATEFNLYSETDHLYIWVRLITRFRDYNVYVHYYDKNYQ